MAIQTPAMATEAEPPFIFVNFWVTESEGIQLSSVTGGGANWIKYLSEVVARFPPTQWAGHARRLAIEFVSEPESRPTAEATEVEKVARQKPVMVAVGPDRTRNLADAGAQHRRKITPEHLQQVAAIYTKAQDAAEPPTRTVSDHFGVSHSTAAKWVGAARKAALLPPVKVAND